MKRRAELPLPSLGEARHLAATGDLRSIEEIDLRPGAEIAAEISATYRPFKPEWPAATTTLQPDNRSDAEITAALKAYKISPEARAGAAERETARQVLLDARTRRRKAKAAPRRRRAVAAGARKLEPKPALPLAKVPGSLWWLMRNNR